MTYLEFFGNNATENVCSCLSCVPDRVVFVGNNSKLIKKHMAYYQRVFENRGHHIQFECKSTPRNDVENAVSVLEKLVKEYEDCVFDITGGDELLLMALGILRERHPELKLQIHKFNLRGNTIYDCDMDGNTIYRDAPQLTGEEHICIYGGGIHFGNARDYGTYRWELDEEFIRDIGLMWNTCKQDVRLWNIQTSIFAAVEATGEQSEDGLTTTVSIPKVTEYMSTGKIQYRHVMNVVEALLHDGLLTCFMEVNGRDFVISYKNEQVKRCLTKAGQVLEMKVYIAAKQSVDKDGIPVYNDVLNGVVMDWDGDLREVGDHSRFDTENEIDVFMMHGVIPVFISCKNGIVTADELYKLNTVAERFGGEYSQKALVATALNMQGASGNHMRQRAKDMHIHLIEDVQNMADEELAWKLGNIWTN